MRKAFADLPADTAIIDGELCWSICAERHISGG